MKKYLVHGLYLGVLAFGLTSPLALSAATIQSTDIYAADGTSGQTLTTGKGVKTGHIQNLAVTGAKIAAGTITTGNIGTGQVTNAILGSNAVTSDKIQDGTIATADLANGAVTDAKITGTISASKIAFTGLNADTIDGLHATAFAPAGQYQNKYGKVAVVAMSGGDYSDPVVAMSSANLASWCGTPSSTNPCLLKIMPGVYNIGAQTVQLPAFVDMEGSGEGTTSIVGSGIASMLNMSSSELRSITLDQNASTDYAYTLIATGVAKLANVTIRATCGYASGGMFGGDSELVLKNVAIILNAGGHQTWGLTIQNSTSLASDLDNVSIKITNGGPGTMGILAAYGTENVVFRNGKVDVDCDPMSSCSGISANGMKVMNSDIRSKWSGAVGVRSISGSRIEGLQQAVAGSLVSFSEVVGPVGAGNTCFNVHDANLTAVSCP
jgi:hypothetical protein